MLIAVDIDFFILLIKLYSASTGDYRLLQGIFEAYFKNDKINEGEMGFRYNLRV